MNKALLAAIFVLAILASCEERYRYHCQDPKNWEQEDCQPPICEAAQNCPEYLKRRNHVAK